MHHRLIELAQLINAKIEGDENLEISGLAKIEEAQAGQLTFITNPKYEKYIHETAASAVLVGVDFPPCEKTLLRCDDPYFAFMNLMQKFYGAAPSLAPGIHPTAILGADGQISGDVAIGANVVIGARCKLGSGVQIHPGVVIENEVEIGAQCILYANVSIRERCRIGNRVIIQMGAVIGSDGFGFAFREGAYHKIPQMGSVVIEDDVEIGANTCIDRATLGQTIIRRGSKLDNLIQIAHNVEIGEHTAVAAQTGISGSARLGKYVRLGGQAGLVGHIEIGDGASIGAQAGVTKSVPKGVFVSGYPAREHMTAKREEAALVRLPELIKRVRRLEAEIERLQSLLDRQP